MENSNLPYKRRKKDLDNTALSNQIGNLQKKTDGISINAKEFGVKGDYDPSTGIGTDDTQKIQDAIDYIESNLINSSLYSSGVTLKFPAGVFKITDSLVINEIIRLEGEGRSTQIHNTSTTGADAIVYSNTKTLFNAGIRDLAIVCDATAGHAINVKYGLAACSFGDLFIFVRNPAKSCVYADFSTVGQGIYDTVFEGGYYFGEKWGRTAPVVEVITRDTLFNENAFRNLRVEGSTGTQAIKIRNNDTDTFLVNNRYENLNFEVCAGGGLYLESAKANTIANISFWDNPTYTGDLISLGNGVGFASTGNILMNITRHGNALGTGAFDINFTNSNDNVLINFNPTASANGKIEFNSRRVTVIGTLTATLSNESNVVKLSSTDGLVTTGVTPVTDIQKTAGTSTKRFLDVYSLRFRPGTGAPLWYSGTGSPEGRDSAPVGSMYTRTEGGTGTTLYVKESGTGNTGWVAK